MFLYCTRLNLTPSLRSVIIHKMASPEHTIPLTEVEIDPDTFSVEEWMGYLKEIIRSDSYMIIK